MRKRKRELLEAVLDHEEDNTLEKAREEVILAKANLISAEEHESSSGYDCGCADFARWQFEFALKRYSIASRRFKDSPVALYNAVLGIR